MQNKRYDPLSLAMMKPKRPLSSYMMWLKSTRSQIKADNPGSKMIDISIRGGELWRGMQDKSIWNERAAIARQQYYKDLQSFIRQGGEIRKKSKRRNKTSVGAIKPNKKTKPINENVNYIRDVRDDRESYYSTQEFKV